MKSDKYFIVLFILFTIQINGCISREQKFNPSSDFLYHENGGVAFDSKKNYADQFPALKSLTPAPGATNPNVVPTPKPANAKRDYVAPQRPTNSPTPSTAKTTLNINNQVTAPPNSPPKRDYVAPQFPTLKPVGSTPATPARPTNPSLGTGNVKDLINYYDNKGSNTPTTTKKPSFSSALQGQGNQPNLPAQTPPGSPNSPGKPSSFSSVVSNKGDKSPSSNPTLTNGGTNKPGSAYGGTATTKLPSKPVLPSSIVNNNNNQGSKNSGPTDAELQTLSEELLKKDTNNAAKYVTISYQEKTTSMSSADKAPLPLLTVSPDVWNIPTVQVFVPLLDNYERDTLVNEYITSQERNEENSFMDAIMATTVMRHLMSFLKDKGYVTPDPKQQRDFIKQMWFGMYSRGKGKISSSGFEHVFVSELNRGEVSGLHNWIYYSKEELANRVNYLGYLKYIPINDKGAVIKMHYNQQGVDKPVGSMFIGTSPELEMALYTLCYVTRVDTDCNLKLGSKDVNVITYNFRYRSKNYIGSAFPQI